MYSSLLKVWWNWGILDSVDFSVLRQLQHIPLLARPITCRPSGFKKAATTSSPTCGPLAAYSTRWQHCSHHFMETSRTCTHCARRSRTVNILRFLLIFTRHSCGIWYRTAYRQIPRVDRRRRKCSRSQRRWTIISSSCPHIHQVPSESHFSCHLSCYRNVLHVFVLHRIVLRVQHNYLFMQNLVVVSCCVVILLCICANLSTRLNMVFPWSQTRY